MLRSTYAVVNAAAIDNNIELAMSAIRQREIY